MSEYIGMMNDFMPTILKYSSLNVKEVDIHVTKLEDGVILEIKSDNNQIGDMLADMMITVAQLAKGKEGKVNVKVDDKRWLLQVMVNVLAKDAD